MDSFWIISFCSLFAVFQTSLSALSSTGVNTSGNCRMGHPEERGLSVTNGSVNDGVKNGLIEGKVDAALEFLRDEDTAVAVEISEKALVRKIDWMIVPMMWAAYNLQYLDKVLSM